MFSFLLLIILYSPPYSRSAWLREGRVARAPAGDVWTSSAVLLDPHTFILTSVTTLRGHPHGCFASSCGRRILSMMPISHPSTSSLQPLNPATSHNINNKNGGLHTRAAEDIESFLQLTGIVVEYDHSSSSTLLSVHTNASGFLALAIFIFFLLCSVSLSTVCLYTTQVLCASSISSSTFLVNFKHHLLAWNVNYSVLSHCQWIRLDANILETIFAHLDTAILLHSSFQNCSSSVRPWTALFKYKKKNIFSGLRSGLWLGHCRAFTSLSFNHFCAAFTACFKSRISL